MNKYKCPICGESMLLFPSLSKMACVECFKEFDWLLEKDQKPLIQHQR